MSVVVAFALPLVLPGTASAAEIKAIATVAQNRSWRNSVLVDCIGDVEAARGAEIDLRGAISMLRDQ
jgi:hypothetical protein